MDESKQPGIRFVEVFITKLHMEMKSDFQPSGKPISYGLTPSYSAQVSPDKKMLAAVLTLNLESQVLKLSVDVCGIFAQADDQNLDLNEFGQAQAMGLLFPFAREVVFNATARTRVAPLLLPPVNVKAMIEQQKQGITPPKDGPVQPAADNEPGRQS